MKGKSSSSGKKQASKATSVKVLNKEANKAKRKSFRHEKEIKRAQRDKRTEENPMLSAEYGVRAVFNMNSQKAKKLEAKRKRKLNEVKRKRVNEERSAPVLPTDVADVLAGRRAAKASGSEKETTLTLAQKQIAELKAKALRSQQTEEVSGDEEESEEEEEGEEEEVVAKSTKKQSKDKKAKKKDVDSEEESEESGNDSAMDLAEDDDDDDEEVDDSDIEFEEPDSEEEAQQQRFRHEKQRMKAEKRARQSKDQGPVDALDAEALIPKPKAIPQQMQARMRAEGKDPVAIMKTRIEKWEQAVRRKREELAQKKMREEEEVEEEGEMEEYAAFFESIGEETLEKAPLLEKVKKQRNKEKQKEREEQAQNPKRKREQDSEDEEEEEDDGVFAFDGPDSDDDDDGEVRGAFDSDVEETALAVAALARGGAHRDVDEKTKKAAAAEKDNTARVMSELAQKELRKREQREAEAKAKSRLMVQLPDGSWGLKEDNEKAPQAKPDLSAYVRQPKEKKKKEAHSEHVEFDPRNSKALSAARAAADTTVDRISMSVEQFRKARMMRLRQVQIVIADLCQEILLSPEKYLPVGHAEALIAMCKDSDKTVRQLAFVSITQVLLDILPSYRIRIPTADELKKEGGAKLSREVARLRAYERCLVDTYYQLIVILKRTVRVALGEQQRSKQGEDANASESSISRVALNCMCRLFEHAANFNHSKEIAAFLATVLTSASESFQETVANTVVNVFRRDIAGDATLEVVKAIAHVFKSRGGERVRAPLLSVLLSLTLNRDVLTAKDEIEHMKKQKKTLAKGAGSHYWMQMQQQKEEERYRMKKAMKTGKEFVAKDNKKGPKAVDERQLARDMAEGEATVSIQQRKKVQSEILSLVFTIYFRYLKQAPTLKSLYSGEQAPTHHQAQSAQPRKDHDGNQRALPWALPTPVEPPSHLLLAAVLKGVCQFAHLINVELVLDLLEHLKQVIGASAREATLSPSAEHEKEDAAAREAALLQGQATGAASGALPLRSALLCVHTSFVLLRMHCQAITIDLHAFYAHFYEMLWQFLIPEETGHLLLALECWDLMVLQPRSLPPARVAALCRRFLLVASYLKPNLAIPIIHAVGLALNKHPKAAVILDNEGQQNGQYDSLIADPDLSHGAGSPAWDLPMWVHSYHPFTQRVLAHALALPDLLRHYKSAHSEKTGVITINGEAAKDHKVGSSQNADEDGLQGFSCSNITITVAGERCLLTRLTPAQLLRALDCSKGAFAPDITMPSQQSIAITNPAAVTPSMHKQALSKASITRKLVLAQPFHPLSVLPATCADVCVGSEPEEVYTEELPKKNYHGLKLELGIDTNMTVRQWLQQPLCLDTREKFDLATRVRKQKHEEVRNKIQIVQALVDAHRLRKALEEMSSDSSNAAAARGEESEEEDDVVMAMDEDDDIFYADENEDEAELEFEEDVELEEDE